MDCFTDDFGCEDMPLFGLQEPLEMDNPSRENTFAFPQAVTAGSELRNLGYETEKKTRDRYLETDKNRCNPLMEDNPFPLVEDNPFRDNMIVFPLELTATDELRSQGFETEKKTPDRYFETDRQRRHPLEIDNPFRERIFAFPQGVTAEDELRNRGSRTEKKKRDRHSVADRKRRDQRLEANTKKREVLDRLLYLEHLEGQGRAGNKKGGFRFEALANRVKYMKRTGSDSEGGTTEEDKPDTPWISNRKLKTRYQSKDLKPWFSELSGPSIKAKPKQARVAASKPSQLAATDAPKRGRGRPRKYALDDPRSSLFRINRQKTGVRQSKKTRDFTIHDDNEGTDGISRSLKPGRPVARPPLTPRRNPPSSKCGGTSGIPPLATSGIRGGDPRGSRGLGSQVSRPQPKVYSETSSEDVEAGTSSERSSSASASPPPPGGGGKSIRRPSFEALFYPGMCPSENEIRDEIARSHSLSRPFSKERDTKVPSPSPRRDPWIETLNYRTLYYGGAHEVNHSG